MRSTEGAELRRELQWRLAGAGPIRPGNGTNGLREGRWRWRARLRGIEAGRQGSAREALATSSARARLGVNARKKKGTGKVDMASRADKNGARRARFTSAHDAWRSLGVGRGMGAEHSDEQGINSDPFDRFFTQL